MRAYISILKQQAEIQSREYAAYLEAQKLPNRIARWFAALSESQQRRTFHINEIANALRVSPSVIGPALVELGWRRVRNWSGDGNFRRGWKPPA